MPEDNTSVSGAGTGKPPVLKKTRRRVLTRRGVMWLGQTCNLRCYFCYFVDRIRCADHPEHAFMSLEKAKNICATLRNFYHCTSIDIQGGEPTIYPGILELTRYCHDIGLYPTLITNGLVLDDIETLEKYAEAKVRDFLVSFHGIGDVHDQVVGRPGAYERMEKAVENMRALGMRFRFNCTMSEPVIPLLPEIAKKAITHGAFVVNFIAFNPFGDQEDGTRNAANVARYSAVKASLTVALDMLEEAGIEANVRFLPYCMAEPRHRKNYFNYQQLCYDTHEWDYESWMWTMMKPQMMRDNPLVPAFRIGPYASALYRGDHDEILRKYAANPLKGRLKFTVQHILARLQQAVSSKEQLSRDEARERAIRDCKYSHHAVCDGCAAKPICDGFHGDYAALFGTDEAAAITDTPRINDPLYFIRGQEKFIEPEDEGWAL